VFAFSFGTLGAVVSFVGHFVCYSFMRITINTRWFKYDRDDLCVNKSQFVPVIFEPPCICMMPVMSQLVLNFYDMLCL
jgi:hypothetical protein